MTTSSPSTEYLSKFLVLYDVDDILLASSGLGLLHDTKTFLIRNFETKDMGEPHMFLALRFLIKIPEVYQRTISEGLNPKSIREV